MKTFRQLNEELQLSENKIVDYLGRKLGVKVTNGEPNMKHAPKWASTVKQTPWGAWHWVEKDGPLETPDSNSYFPHSGKTKFTGFVSKPKEKAAQTNEDSQLDESNLFNLIPDASDRRKAIALHAMGQQRVSNSKKSKSPIQKSHHMDMANQHFDAANDILHKHGLIEELGTQLGEENKARESLKSGLDGQPYSSSARLYPSNKAGHQAAWTGPSKTKFSAKRTALGLKPTVRKNWSTANEEYDVGSMLEYIEELESALDESGNPFKRLDSLEFQTKSKAAVDSLKGDKKKENLHNSQLKRLSSVRNKLATEETE